MQDEEKIAQELSNNFKALEGKVTVTQPRRISAEVGLADFRKVFEFCIKKLNFSILCAITGLDEGEKLGAIYHLAQEHGTVLNLKTSVDKQNPVLKTVSGYFPVALIYEREIVDLLGFQVEGLPSGNRYPLTDDWPVNEFPLRKDWKPHTHGEEEAHTHA
jgi:Ni,Fe-hydrogenase III component G